MGSGLLDPGWMLAGMFYAAAMFGGGFGLYFIASRIKGAAPAFVATGAVLACMWLTDNGYAF